MMKHTALLVGLTLTVAGGPSSALAQRPPDPAARDVWEHYLGRWTIWNHVRTAAAMVAALLYTLGLMQNGGT